MPPLVVADFQERKFSKNNPTTQRTSNEVTFIHSHIGFVSSEAKKVLNRGGVHCDGCADQNPVMRPFLLPFSDPLTSQMNNSPL
jgi:hypothetical protein